MRVWIAEKPSVGRAIAAHLSSPQKATRSHIECGNGDVVTWCFGHLLHDFKPDDYSDTWSWKGLGEAHAAGTLESALPMCPDEFKLKPSKESKEQFETVKRLVKAAESIVHAGDIDREGQLIVDELLQFVGNRRPVMRLDTSSLDDVNLSRAIKSLTDNAKNATITEAGYARREADWLFGMNLTVAVTFAARKSGFSDGVLNVGRVKTPTMRLVVDRDREIENFKPVAYFVLAASFKTSAGDVFAATWKPNPEQVVLDPEKRLLMRAPADALTQRIANAPAVVKRYSDEEKKQGPKLLYALSDLQADASRIYGFPVDRTLQLAQKLYEAKITTYPRTDCKYVPEAQLADAPAVLANVAQIYPDVAEFCKQADPSRKSQAWNDKKVTAHHAILPTPQRVDLSQLDDEQRKIYDLIVRRYLAQFLTEYRYRAVAVEIECAGERFTATGQTPVAAGWKALYGANVADEDEEKRDDEDESSQKIPRLTEGEQTTCVGGKVGAKDTKPPRRFTEGTLVKAMAAIHEYVTDPEIRKRLKENDGIGTEATRASIIAELKKGEFFALQGKNVVSSPRCRGLIDALKSISDRLTDYGVTAQVEQNLSRIADGTLTRQQFRQTFMQFVTAACKAALRATVMIPAAMRGPSKGGGKRKFSKAGAGPKSGIVARKTGLTRKAPARG